VSTPRPSYDLTRAAPAAPAPIGDNRDGLVVSSDPTRHPAAVYLARLSPGSRRTMREALDTVAAIVKRGQTAATLPWHELRYEQVQAIWAVLAQRYAPATANKLLAALKGTLKEAWRLGLVDGEVYQRAADVAGVKATTLPRGRALSRGELTALLARCTEEPGPGAHGARGARDAAPVAVLYGAGLRRAEAAALGLVAIDRPGRGPGRELATLWFEDAGLGQAVWAEGEEHHGEQRQG
jgi:integrase/recombinase XerD